MAGTLLRAGARLVLTLSMRCSQLTSWYRQSNTRDGEIHPRGWRRRASWWAHEGAWYSEISAFEVVAHDNPVYLDGDAGAGAVCGSVATSP